MITHMNTSISIIRKGQENVCRSVRFALACDHDRNARIYAWKLPSAFFRSVYDRKADGEKRCMDGICTFCENILPREYGRSDPTEKYDDQKSGIVETAFSDHLQRSDRHLCTGTRIWHRNDARRKCGESKCDRGGDERTCVFLYVFRSDHCFDLIRSSSDRFERLGE